MKDNPVLQAMLERRSIRRFTDEDVPDEVIKAVLEAGRWAPSGKNNQPCRFLVVKRGDPRQQGLAGCTAYKRIVLAAAVNIAVFLDKGSMYHDMKDHQSAGACIQNMLLAVHSLGWGAVWLGEIVNQEPQVHQVLGTDPGMYEFMALLAVGRPAETGRSTRMEPGRFLLEEF